MSFKDDFPFLFAYVEPSALVDDKAQLLGWNTAFDKLVNGLEVGKEFPLLGHRIPAAFRSADGGEIGIGQVYHETDGTTDPNWVLLALPQPYGRRLALLTQGEASQAFHDELTGLPNRRDAHGRLDLEWRRMLRSVDSRFSIALVDIDHFKNINDRFGHEVGDEALRFVAKELDSSMRAGDWIARWGGEEFLLFLHQTDLDEAGKVAERIRSNLASKVFRTPSGVELRLTACFGVVCSDALVTSGADTETCLTTMVNSADVLLYDAKMSGRNCCMVSEAGETTFWNADDLDEMVNNDRITAVSSSVTDFNDKVVGQSWLMHLPNAGERAPRRMARSALMLNRANKIDACLLRVVSTLHKLGEHGETAYVPISSSSLMQLVAHDGLKAAIDEVTARGIKLALVINDEHLVTETPVAALTHLRERGIGLCLRVSASGHLPSGIIAHLSPASAMLENHVATAGALRTDLCRILIDHGVRPILPQESDDRELGDQVLYVAGHPVSA